MPGECCEEVCWVKTFYKVFYYKDIELLAYPVGNEPNEEDKEIFPKQNWRLIIIFRQMKSSVERN